MCSCSGASPFALVPSPWHEHALGLPPHPWGGMDDRWRRATPINLQPEAVPTPAKLRTHRKEINVHCCVPLTFWSCYAAFLWKELTDSVTDGQCLWKAFGSHFLDLFATTGATDDLLHSSWGSGIFCPLSLGLLYTLLWFKFSFFCLSLKCSPKVLSLALFFLCSLSWTSTGGGGREHTLSELVP